MSGISLLEFGNQNLTAKDIGDKDTVLTVDAVTTKTYQQTNQKGQNYDKKMPCLKVHLMKGKQVLYKDFLLNRTNREAVISEGVVIIDDLIGGTITVRKELVDFGEKQVAGIRVIGVHTNGQRTGKADAKADTKTKE